MSCPSVVTVCGRRYDPSESKSVSCVLSCILYCSPDIMLHPRPLAPSLILSAQVLLRHIWPKAVHTILERAIRRCDYRLNNRLCQTRSTLTDGSAMFHSSADRFMSVRSLSHFEVNLPLAPLPLSLFLSLFLSLSLSLFLSVSLCFFLFFSLSDSLSISSSSSLARHLCVTTIFFLVRIDRF